MEVISMSFTYDHTHSEECPRHPSPPEAASEDNQGLKCAVTPQCSTTPPRHYKNPLISPALHTTEWLQRPEPEAD